MLIGPCHVRLFVASKECTIKALVHFLLYIFDIRLSIKGMAQSGNGHSDVRKKVLVVGAGAAG